MDVDKWLGSITLYEAVQIWDQLNCTCEPDKLVLWSGIEFEQAQSWARNHDRKTLTQAMGPLMDKSSTRCRYNMKNVEQWCLYVHAASILFTLFISSGKEVVVLTRHPPERFNPYHESYYQNIEEPWLTACHNRDDFKIMLAHPEIKGARDYIYQYWPVDEVDDWKTSFPHPRVPKPRPWPHHSWRSAKTSEYELCDLKQERCKIMEKLYIYKTGASTYWVVTSPANTLTVLRSAKRSRSKKRRRKCDAQQPSEKANASRPDTSTPPQQSRSGSPRIKTKSASKTSTSSPTSTKKKNKKKKRAKRAKIMREQASKADQSRVGTVISSRAKAKAVGATKTTSKAKQVQVRNITRPCSGIYKE